MYALLIQVSSVVFINITILSHRSAKKDGLHWPDLIYCPQLLRQIYTLFISFFVFFPPLRSFYGFKKTKRKN